MANETLQVSENPWNKSESAWIIIFVSMILLTGLVGNTLVIVVTLINCTLKTTANALIVNLAVADILATCSFTTMISSLAQGTWIYGDIACRINGFAVMTFGLASALSISAISINRYLVTVNLTAYRSTFGAKNRTLFLLVILWVFAGTFGCLPLVGWSRYEYYPARGFCFWSYSASLSYTITFYTLVAPCCLAAAFCYWKIYLKIRHNKVIYIQKLSLATPPKTSNKIKRRQELSNELSERKTTLAICVVVLVYYTTLAPFTIVNLMIIWKPGYEISPSVDIVTTIVAMMNLAINVFIYSTLNRKYRKAIRDLFEKIKGYFWPSDGNRVQSFKRSRRQTPKHDITWC